MGTIESFREETVDFVNRLRAQGAEVAFKECEGCFRAFDMMGAGTGIGKDAGAFLLENAFLTLMEKLPIKSDAFRKLQSQI